MSFSVRVSVVAAVMTVSAAAAGPSLVRPGNAIAETATAENVVIISKGGRFEIASRFPVTRSASRRTASV